VAPSLSQSAYLPPPPAPPAAPAPPTVRLLPPEITDPPAARDEAPAPRAPDAPTPALPSGIPDFAPAVPGRVANGRKPLLDGLDWLKANGYRGALSLRRPADSDAADGRQFEQRGLRFASLAVSPETLSKATVAEFARLVNDQSMQPLFVYDADGSVAGALWYLYFRQVERLPDDVARIRAGRLGLRDGQDPTSRAMWLAIQRVLAS
jgi:hypothetical protein